MVQQMRKKYGSDLIQAYQQAKAKGYTRSYGCFKRTARRTLPPTKPPRKRKNKPYQRAAYPSEKVQVDVKYTARKANAAVGRTAKCMPGTARIVPKISCAAW